MINLTDIHSLTDFQRSAKAYTQQIKETKKPLVLPAHGKAEIITQDAETYQALLARLERAETVAAFRESIASFDRGKRYRCVRQWKKCGKSGGFNGETAGSF